MKTKHINGLPIAYVPYDLLENIEKRGYIIEKNGDMLYDLMEDNLTAHWDIFSNIYKKFNYEAEKIVYMEEWASYFTQNKMVIFKILNKIGEKPDGMVHIYVSPYGITTEQYETIKKIELILISMSGNPIRPTIRAIQPYPFEEIIINSIDEIPILQSISEMGL